MQTVTLTVAHSVPRAHNQARGLLAAPVMREEASWPGNGVVAASIDEGFS